VSDWVDAWRVAGGTSRKFVVGGNWKCNGSVESVSELVGSLNAAVEAHEDFFTNCEVIVAPPMLHLAAVHKTMNPLIKVAAQDVHFAGNGAYTGEVSADMLINFGLEWVITGHSERRAAPATGYGVMADESSELIARKTKYALDKGLNVILCIGETLEDREAGNTLAVCKEQLAPAVELLSPEDWSRVVLAYEPVWAIGTGKSATKEDAQDTHEGIRSYLAVAVSPEVASALRIQYGGSVKPENAGELAMQPDIDGFLVGGAALMAESFATIVGATKTPVDLYPHVRASFDNL